MIEPGYNCGGGIITGPDTCTEVCGDGYDWGQHECDDNNNVSGDGCSLICNVEVGWQCYDVPAVCGELCGDGLDFGNYGCDDGNFIDEDGCDKNCNVETGYTCNNGTPF